MPCEIFGLSRDLCMYELEPSAGRTGICGQELSALQVRGGTFACQREIVVTKDMTAIVPRAKGVVDARITVYGRIARTVPHNELAAFD